MKLPDVVAPPGFNPVAGNHLFESLQSKIEALGFARFNPVAGNHLFERVSGQRTGGRCELVSIPLPGIIYLKED